MNSTGKPSIAVLTSHSLNHYALLNAMNADFQLKLIAFEDRKWFRLRLFHRRLSRLGPRRVLDQLAFKVLDELFFQRVANKLVAQFMGVPPVFDPRRFPETRIIDKVSVNSEAVVNAIKQTSPDVVVVSGVSILAPQTIKAIGTRNIINLHCGITPRYRGTHGAYWAVVNGDWENAGATVHLVDQGLDTGAIICQQNITVEPGDNPRTLVVKQHKVGVGLLREAIDLILAHDEIRLINRPDLDSRVYSSPTLSTYLVFKRRLRERFAL